MSRRDVRLAIASPVRRDMKRQKTLALLRAIASALVGGSLFWLAGLPMPWLLGSIVGTAGLTMAGIDARVPRIARDLVLIVLGLMIGATLEPAILSNVIRWPLSLLGVIIYVILVTASQYLFFRRVGGYDAPTAYFSAAPGGFMAMTVIGGEYGGAERVIALMHAVRVVLVVFAIVIGYHLVVGAPAEDASHYVALSAISPGHLLLLGVVGAAGALVSRLLRLPGGFMLGPLIVMGLVQVSGLVHVSVPSGPILVAEVVLGSSIGAQFAGTTWAELRRGFLLSLISTMAMLALSAIFGLAVGFLTGLPLAALFLAYSPGGMSGISLIALALHIEPAFVTLHNMLRVLIILIAGPALFRLRSRRDD